MRRLWVANDVYDALTKEMAQRELSAVGVLRELLGLPHPNYTSCPKTKSEGVRKGIEKAKRRGVIIGRPRYPEYVREQARRMAKSGWSLAAIGAIWGMSRSTVRRVLRER